MAAPAYKSVGTLGQGDNGTSGTVTVPIPAGVSAGDVLVMQYHCLSGMTPTTPSGWTHPVGPVALGGSSTGFAGHLFTKVSAGSESSSVNVAKTGTGNFASAIIAVYSGADTTTPVDVSATGAIGASTNPLPSPSVTTTKTDTLILRMYWATRAGSLTITPTAGTERYDTYDGNFNMAVETGDVSQSAAGASGTSSATPSGTIDGGLAATVALAPAVTSTTYTKAGNGICGFIGSGVSVKTGPVVSTKTGHATVGLTAGGTDVFRTHFGHAAAGLVGSGTSASIYVESGYALIGGMAAGFLLTSRLSVAPTDVLVLTPETEGSFVLAPETPDSFVLTPIESDEFVLTTP